MPILLSFDNFLSENLIEKMATARKVKNKEIGVGFSPVINAIAITVFLSIFTAKLRRRRKSAKFYACLPASRVSFSDPDEYGIGCQDRGISGKKIQTIVIHPACRFQRIVLKL